MQEQIVYLRQLLAETIPAGKTEADTNFMDWQLAELLNRHQNFNAAAAEGWTVKAAKWAGLVDIEELGSVRRLSQKPKSALAVADRFAKQAATDLTQVTTASRVSPVASGVWFPSMRMPPSPIEVEVLNNFSQWIQYSPVGVGEQFLPILPGDPSVFGSIDDTQPDKPAPEVPWVLEVEKNRTLVLGAPYFPDGDKPDLTNWTATIVIGTPGQVPVWTGTIGNGGISVDVPNNIFKVTITPAVSNAFAVGQYLFEIVGTSSTGEQVIIANGPAFITQGLVP